MLLFSTQVTDSNTEKGVLCGTTVPDCCFQRLLQDASIVIQNTVGVNSSLYGSFICAGPVVILDTVPPFTVVIHSTIACCYVLHSSPFAVVIDSTARREKGGVVIHSTAQVAFPSGSGRFIALFSVLLFLTQLHAVFVVKLNTIAPVVMMHTLEPTAHLHCYVQHKTVVNQHTVWLLFTAQDTLLLSKK